MTVPTTVADPISRIHFWLANPCRLQSEGPGLRIEHFAGDYHPLSPGLAAHFSEYDDACGSDWLCLNAADVAIACRDGSVLKALGFAETEDIPVEDLLAGLFRKGRLMLERHISPDITSAGESSFRVALVPSGAFQPPGFHLAVDPLKFSPSCLVAVIGDTFLEWLNNRDEILPEGPAEP